MVLRKSNILKKKAGRYREIFIFTVTFAFLFAAASSGFYSKASGLGAVLGKLNFHYPDDGSIKIELVSDRPVGDYQIRTLGNKTIIRFRGVRSKLLPSYLVRNGFDVEVHTAGTDADGEPGV